MDLPSVVIVMGVSGCGKSTVGALLASALRGDFHDADDYHPQENIAKMAAGIPLDDADRAPWLARLRREVIDPATPARPTVLACSALKKAYRTQLGVGTPGIVLAYLHGTREQLLARLTDREGHFMKAALLDSQLATLEEPSPAEAILLDITHSPLELVATLETSLART